MLKVSLYLGNMLWRFCLCYTHCFLRYFQFYNFKMSISTVGLAMRNCSEFIFKMATPIKRFLLQIQTAQSLVFIHIYRMYCKEPFHAFSIHCKQVFENYTQNLWASVQQTRIHQEFLRLCDNHVYSHKSPYFRMEMGD